MSYSSLQLPLPLTQNLHPYHVRFDRDKQFENFYKNLLGGRHFDVRRRSLDHTRTGMVPLPEFDSEVIWDLPYKQKGPYSSVTVVSTCVDFDAHRSETCTSVNVFTVIPIRGGI